MFLKRKREEKKSKRKKQKREKRKMHRDNKYVDKPPNFEELANLYPNFKKL